MAENIPDAAPSADSTANATTSMIDAFMEAFKKSPLSQASANAVDISPATTNEPVTLAPLSETKPVEISNPMATDISSRVFAIGLQSDSRKKTEPIFNEEVRKEIAKLPIQKGKLTYDKKAMKNNIALISLLGIGAGIAIIAGAAIYDSHRRKKQNAANQQLSAEKEKILESGEAEVINSPTKEEKIQLEPGKIATSSTKNEKTTSTPKNELEFPQEQTEDVKAEKVEGQEETAAPVEGQEQEASPTKKKHRHHRRRADVAIIDSQANKGGMGYQYEYLRDKIMGDGSANDADLQMTNKDKTYISMDWLYDPTDTIGFPHFNAGVFEDQMNGSQNGGQNGGNGTTTKQEKAATQSDAPTNAPTSRSLF